MIPGTSRSAPAAWAPLLSPATGGQEFGRPVPVKAPTGREVTHPPPGCQRGLAPRRHPHRRHRGGDGVGWRRYCTPPAGTGCPPPPRGAAAHPQKAAQSGSQPDRFITSSTPFHRQSIRPCSDKASRRSVPLCRCLRHRIQAAIHHAADQRGHNHRAPNQRHRQFSTPPYRRFTRNLCPFLFAYVRVRNFLLILPKFLLTELYNLL